MKKIRNPRFAPEFLERKLSPSTVSGSLPSAMVCNYSTSTGGSTDPLPMPGTYTPPSGLPPIPETGPVVPA